MLFYTVREKLELIYTFKLILATLYVSGLEINYSWLTTKLVYSFGNNVVVNSHKLATGGQQSKIINGPAKTEHSSKNYS